MPHDPSKPGWARGRPEHPILWEPTARPYQAQSGCLVWLGVCGGLAGPCLDPTLSPIPASAPILSPLHPCLVPFPASSPSLVPVSASFPIFPHPHPCLVPIPASLHPCFIPVPASCPHPCLLPSLPISIPACPLCLPAPTPACPPLPRCLPRLLPQDAPGPRSPGERRYLLRGLSRSNRGGGSGPRKSPPHPHTPPLSRAPPRCGRAGAGSRRGRRGGGGGCTFPLPSGLRRKVSKTGIFSKKQRRFPRREKEPCSDREIPAGNIEKQRIDIYTYIYIHRSYIK